MRVESRNGAVIIDTYAMWWRTRRLLRKLRFWRWFKQKPPAPKREPVGEHQSIAIGRNAGVTTGGLRAMGEYAVAIGGAESDAEADGVFMFGCRNTVVKAPNVNVTRARDLVIQAYDPETQTFDIVRTSLNTTGTVEMLNPPGFLGRVELFIQPGAPGVQIPNRPDWIGQGCHDGRDPAEFGPAPERAPWTPATIAIGTSAMASVR